jgi:uncharacterized protein (TIGR03790 family)
MTKRTLSGWIRICGVSLLVSFTASAGTTVSGDDPATVLIIVNDATPPEAGTNGVGASVWVGQHYAAARGIPTSNIFHINYGGWNGLITSPQDWSNYYLDWDSYVGLIRDPLRQFLATNNLTDKINYIVPTYGVPFKTEIGNLADQTNLSIDSYLATLNSDASNTFESNPYHATGYTDLTRPHFRDFTNTGGTKIYIVSRMDGPSAVEAASLVDKAMSAEQSLRVGSGMSYFDTFGGTTGKAVSFDNAYHATLAAGFPSTENISGNMTTHAPNTQFAWGWYGSDTGAYTFLNGAVGAQLTSYTANQIRTAGGVANWVPNWIHAGITATWGATGEPYTNGYTMGDVLLNEFYHGYNFGESALLATPFLHWMMIFVGDPLYAPYIFQNVPPPPPQIPTINYFGSSRATISAGQWTQLYWSVAGATSVTIDNGIGNAPAQVLVSPTATTTYTLTASSSAGSSTAKLTITVAGSTAPTISAFTTSPASIISGGSSTLSWSVSGATSLSLNQGLGDVTSLSSKSVAPATTTTYILTATNSSGSVTALATVTVSPPPIIYSFTASSSIASGGSSTLSWSVGGATSLSLNQGLGDVTSLSYKSVSPIITTTYILTATNSSGSVIASATVTVSPASPPQIPTINYFNAARSTITTGQWAQLYWSVSGATSVTIDNGIGDAPAQVLVFPTATTTYTLTASNSAGSSTSKLTIRVASPAPTIVPITAGAAAPLRMY